jgi:hypothetical protein
MTERALAVLAHISAVERSLEKLREPIEVAPFLAWCEQREERIRREIDNYPAISGNREGGVTPRFPIGEDARGRLVMELGWGAENGARLLYRWTHEIAGLVERAKVEEALFAAGAHFAEVYPDAPSPRRLVVRLGQGRKMTDAQVRAAYVLYTQGRMTTTTLGQALWRKFGYASDRACSRALLDAFQGFGLPLRKCAGITSRGARCGGSPLHGTDFCVEHRDGFRPSRKGGLVSARRQAEGMFRPSEEFVTKVREMYEGGMRFGTVAAAVIGETPLSSSHYLANCLSDIAVMQGWHRTRTLSDVTPGRQRRAVLAMRSDVGVAA